MVERTPAAGEQSASEVMFQYNQETYALPRHVVLLLEDICAVASHRMQCFAWFQSLLSLQQTNVPGHVRICWIRWVQRETFPGLRELQHYFGIDDPHSFGESFSLTEGPPLPPLARAVFSYVCVRSARIQEQQAIMDILKERAGRMPG